MSFHPEVLVAKVHFLRTKLLWTPAPSLKKNPPPLTESGDKLQGSVEARFATGCLTQFPKSKDMKQSDSGNSSRNRSGICPKICLGTPDKNRETAHSLLEFSDFSPLLCSLILQFPNAVVLTAVGRRSTQVSAKERNGALPSAKICKQPGLKRPDLGTSK